MPDLVQLQTLVDTPSPCPYLDGMTARMPLQIPAHRVAPAAFDELLAAGYRRSGWFYYRTACPNCQACESLRVDVPEFRESRSLRRVRARGDAALTLKIQHPSCDATRLALFNRHRNERHMARGEGDANADDYGSFLIASNNPTLELSYWLADRLAAVAIVDAGRSSLSAVYCYFDPDLGHLSLGTYSILKQIELCKQLEARWLYLGMYVSENRHLRYKARYYPHERFQAGSWRRYEVEAE
jgi:leucyl-tRNA---protein transferase